MADFGGFEVQTPQEVLAKLNAQRQQISQLAPTQQRNANIQFQLQNVFGNPELEKAREIEDNMKTAQNYVKQHINAPEGSLDHESARLRSMYDAVKDLDPMAASQIQRQLVAVKEAQFQKSRLKQADTRADRGLAIREESAARAAKFDDWNFTVDSKGNVVSYDPEDPTSLEEFQGAVDQGATPLTQAQAAQMLGRAKTQQAMSDRFNKSSHEKRVLTYNSHDQFLKKGARLIDVLAKMPSAGTNIAEIQKGIAGLVTEGRSFVSALAGPDNERFSLGATEKSIEEKIARLEDEQLPVGVGRAQFRSLVLNMGYVLARGLDSGGRLSDQDVNMAISMLVGGTIEGGFINPRIMTSVMLQNAVGIQDQLNGVDSVLFTEERAGAGDRQSQDILALQSKVNDAYNDIFLPSVRRVLSEDEITFAVEPFKPGETTEAPASGFIIE